MEFVAGLAVGALSALVGLLLAMWRRGTPLH